MSVRTHLQEVAETVKILNPERDKINTSIRSLETKLNAYFNSIQEKFVFGSYDRKTILKRNIDPDSDVDYMIVFSDGNNYRPQTLITRLKSFAEYYYSRSEIYQSSPTIVLELNHIKFELVPAYTYWGTYYIPAPASGYDDWMVTSPFILRDNLINKNNQNGHQIRKLVRILKYWNTTQGKVYSSYELESYVIGTAFWFCNNLKDYFYVAVENLPTYHLNGIKQNKVNNLKAAVRAAKSFESSGYTASAQQAIQRLVQ